MFTDAKGGVPLCVAKGQHHNKGIGQTQSKVEPKQDKRLVVKCKIYGKPHLTYKCWHNPDDKKVASSAQFDIQYKGDKCNWGQDRNHGRIDQRDNHYDNNNYRTHHQVNFCKIDYRSLDVGKGPAKFSSPHSSTEGLPRKDSKALVISHGQGC